MTKENGQFSLRLTPALKQMIQASADQNHRSLNGEVAHRLLDSLTEKQRIAVWQADYKAQKEKP
jgi:hypothetical protein